MSIMDFFRTAKSWRDRATALATQLADIEAERERLEGEASALLIAGQEDTGREARDRRLDELGARARDLRRAHAEADAKASAEEAAAEAERQRREAEAARRRREEAEASYLQQVEQVERAVKALGAAVVELCARGEAIAQLDGSIQAGRFFSPAEIVDRIANTQWKHLRVGGSPERPLVLSIPPTVGAFAGARRELRETERDVLAALHEDDAPTPPAPAARSPRPLLASDEPEAA